ncbi:MAG: hypothetical protein U0Q08_00070 [Dermatophilaceae bacterium]
MGEFALEEQARRLELDAGRKDIRGGALIVGGALGTSLLLYVIGGGRVVVFGFAVLIGLLMIGRGALTVARQSRDASRPRQPGSSGTES